MRKVLIALSVCAASTLVSAPAFSAAATNYEISKAPINTKDMKVLQNGAQLFANNCMGCHGASFVRYSKLRDIGFTVDILPALKDGDSSCELRMPAHENV